MGGLCVFGMGADVSNADYYSIDWAPRCCRGVSVLEALEVGGRLDRYGRGVGRGDGGDPAPLPALSAGKQVEKEASHGGSEKKPPHGARAWHLPQHLATVLRHDTLQGLRQGDALSKRIVGSACTFGDEA